MKVYLGIKFHEDLSNKAIIDEICSCGKQEGHDVICMHKDIEQWGNTNFSSQELMYETFKTIDKCDAVIIEFTESDTEIGIEAGYAVAKNIPLYILLPIGGQ